MVYHVHGLVVKVNGGSCWLCVWGGVEDVMKWGMDLLEIVVLDSVAY